MTAPTSAPAARPSLSLTDIRGAGYPALTARPSELVSYIRTLLADSEPAALDRYKRATQNLMFADGRQHIDWSLRDRAWKEVPAPEGTVRVTNNYIRPILRSRHQRMMSAEMNWRCVPTSNEHEARDRARVAEWLIRNRWSFLEMDAKVRAGLYLADNCGVAYLKQFWNAAIGPLTKAQVTLPHPQTGVPTVYPVDADGRPLMDDQGNPLDGNDLAFTYRPGDTDSALRTVFNVRTNPDAVGLEPSDGLRWLIDTDVVPIYVVREIYKERAMKVQSDHGVSQMRQFENILRALAPVRTTASNDLLTGRTGQTLPDRDLTLLAQYWEAPSESLPRGRLIITAGNELMYPLTPEEVAMGLPQGFVPYVPIYSERRPFDAGGRPVVDDLIGPQRVINKQWGAVLMEQHLAGVGQWAMFDIPGLSDQITNGSGAHIRIPVQSALANRGISELIQRINPAVSSPDRWRMIEAAKATMFDIGAFHEIQRGQVPPGVDSGIAVQLLQDAENGQLHDAVRTLRRSLISWARQTGKMARWGYGEDEKRWIPVERADLGFLVESVTGADLPDFDAIDIDLEGFRPSSRAAQDATIRDAMKEGWVAPRDGLRLMDLGRGIEGAFESETRHYTKARQENLAIEKSEFQVVEAPEGSPTAGAPAFLHPDGMAFMLPSEDDHEVHVAIHQEIALDSSRPTATRKASLLHIAEHRMVMQQMAQASFQAELAAKAPRPTTPATATPEGASDAGQS